MYGGGSCGLSKKPIFRDRFYQKPGDGDTHITNHVADSGQQWEEAADASYTDQRARDYMDILDGQGTYPYRFAVGLNDSNIGTDFKSLYLCNVKTLIKKFSYILEGTEGSAVESRAVVYRCNNASNLDAETSAFIMVGHYHTSACTGSLLNPLIREWVSGSWVTRATAPAITTSGNYDFNIRFHCREDEDNLLSVDCAIVKVTLPDAQFDQFTWQTPVPVSDQTWFGLWTSYYLYAFNKRISSLVAFS